MGLSRPFIGYTYFLSNAINSVCQLIITKAGTLRNTGAGEMLFNALRWNEDTCGSYVNTYRACPHHR